MFEIERTLSFNSDVLTPGDEYDYVTRTSLNQGILKSTGFVNASNINPAGTWSLGLLQMDFFYRQKPWYAGQFVRKVTPKISIPPKAVHFFTAVLNKQKARMLSVLVRNADQTFRTAAVKLPVTGEGRLDFDFMERLVAQLEARRHAELEAYLSAAGLKDTRLTPGEKAAIEKFECMAWKQFNLKELFGASTRGKRLKSADRTAGPLPFVTAGEAEQGVSAFIGNDVTVFPKNTVTVDMFGSAKYRNYAYGADDHIAVVHTQRLPPFAAIFLTAAIHKAAHTGKFSYAKNFYAKDADELEIMLPVQNGEPDYGAMELAASAIQKQVVGGVVSYSVQKQAESRQAAE